LELQVSVLFNEPKLLKSAASQPANSPRVGFSALQRAEIAEICRNHCSNRERSACFSALQRAEIAEMTMCRSSLFCPRPVSVLFNEPKLLKSWHQHRMQNLVSRFSALQRAEIAEISSWTRSPRD